MKLILILIIQLASLTLPAQSILDIYLLLPDKAAIGDKVTREQMITNFKNGNEKLDNIHYRFGKVDEKNGYLNVVGIFEGNWEMCYWNLSNEKLVAAYFQGSGGVSYIEQFNFYSLKNGLLTPLDIETVIPGYESIYKDFFIKYSDELKDELEKKDIIASLLFKIPQHGKNIVALFGNEDTRETYQKYFKGDRMIIKWDNGKFTKGEIYWDK